MSESAFPNDSAPTPRQPTIEEGLSMVQLLAPEWDEAAEWLFLYGDNLRSSHAFVLAVARRLTELEYQHSEIQRALIVIFGAPLLSKMLGSKVKFEA